MQFSQYLLMYLAVVVLGFLSHCSSNSLLLRVYYTVRQRSRSDESLCNLYTRRLLIRPYLYLVHSTYLLRSFNLHHISLRSVAVYEYEYEYTNSYHSSKPAPVTSLRVCCVRFLGYNKKTFRFSKYKFVTNTR